MNNKNSIGDFVYFIQFPLCKDNEETIDALKNWQKKYVIIQIEKISYTIRHKYTNCLRVSK